MVIVKAIAAALFGAVFGFFFLAVAAYPLLVAAEGGRDLNGGIAMGVFTGLGPLGAVLGAALGFGLILWLNQAKQETDAERPAARRGGRIAMGAVVALVVGYFALLIALQGPAKIRLDKADLQFEVRAPKSLVAQIEDFTPHSGLHDAHTDEVIPIASTVRAEGDMAIVSGSYRPSQKYDGLRLCVELAPDLAVIATVPTTPGMEVAPDFTDWFKVDRIDNPKTGESELAYNQETHMYRYRALLREHD